jgi:hypothetical protein
VFPRVAPLKDVAQTRTVRSKHRVHAADVFPANAYFGGLSWFLYLFTGSEVSGKWGHHFWPSHFGEHAAEVLVSLVCLGIWVRTCAGACVVRDFACIV